MRVGINLEQLLFRPPGGVGRYTARLATLLPDLFADDEYRGFVARHLGPLDLPLPVSVSPLPRPLLYDAWHVLGIGGIVKDSGEFDDVGCIEADDPCTDGPVCLREATRSREEDHRE